VDADLKDFFGSVEHAKPLTLVAQRIADCNGSHFPPASRAVFLRLVPAAPEPIEKRRRNRARQTHGDRSVR
jgi:hypothetical protein